MKPKLEKKLLEIMFFSSALGSEDLGKRVPKPAEMVANTVEIDLRRARKEKTRKVRKRTIVQRFCTILDVSGIGNRTVNQIKGCRKRL